MGGVMSTAAPPIPKRHRAFAVRHCREGLLIETTRASVVAAKEAAIKLVKRPGIGWRDLEKDGCRVVAVTVAIAVDPPPRPQRTLTTHGRPIRQ
jgi:hypothetical protein